MVALLAAAAFAHPVGERFATQTSVLHLHADRIDVRYVAEVPHAILRTGATTDVLDRMADELYAGLLLQVDGGVVSMTRSEPAVAAPSSEHTFAFTLSLSAPLPSDAIELRLSTANLPDASNYYAGDVLVEPGLTLTACSLLTLEDGRIVRDDTLRWRRDESARSLTATLAPERSTWFSGSDTRHAGKALTRPGPPIGVGLGAAGVVVVLVLIAVKWMAPRRTYSPAERGGES